MGRNSGIIGTWPPSGWTKLAAIERFEGQAVTKNLTRARIYGLQYKIDAIPLMQDERPSFRYELLIDGWEYSILNESTEYPVLSFSFTDCMDSELPVSHFLGDVRVLGVAVPETPKASARALSAALFFLRHIAKDTVPDVHRVLRSYKLHPSQHYIYQDKAEPGYSLKGIFPEGYTLPPSRR